MLRGSKVCSVNDNISVPVLLNKAHKVKFWTRLLSEVYLQDVSDILFCVDVRHLNEFHLPLLQIYGVSDRPFSNIGCSHDAHRTNSNLSVWNALSNEKGVSTFHVAESLEPEGAIYISIRWVSWLVLIMSARKVWSSRTLLVSIPNRVVSDIDIPVVGVIFCILLITNACYTCSDRVLN